MAQAETQIQKVLSDPSGKPFIATKTRVPVKSDENSCVIEYVLYTNEGRQGLVRSTYRWVGERFWRI